MLLFIWFLILKSRAVHLLLFISFFILKSRAPRHYQSFLSSCGATVQFISYTIFAEFSRIATHPVFLGFLVCCATSWRNQIATISSSRCCRNPGRGPPSQKMKKRGEACHLSRVWSWPCDARQLGALNRHFMSIWPLRRRASSARSKCVSRCACAREATSHQAGKNGCIV